MVPWQLLLFICHVYIYIIDNMIDKQLIVMSIIFFNYIVHMLGYYFLLSLKAIIWVYIICCQLKRSIWTAVIKVMIRRIIPTS
ncbi:MAG: hypothetical protein ACKPKO_18245, partial [Candidatus Fonsibacter sp.]